LVLGVYTLSRLANLILNTTHFLSIGTVFWQMSEIGAVTSHLILGIVT